MATPDVTDVTGRVVTVRDMLDRLRLSLKYTNYQLDTGGTGKEPHPRCWTESSGLARGVLQRQATLLEHVAGDIERWVRASPDEDPVNLAAMKAAVKDYRAVARSLLRNAKRMRNAQGCLERTRT